MDENDLKLFRSAVVNNGNTNGGRRGYTEILTAVQENLFPIVTHEERVAGLTRYRKFFFCDVNASDEAAPNARFIAKTPTNGEDLIAFFEGTQRDTQADITGSEKQYAAGVLASAAASGATQVVVDFEDATQVDLAAADKLWLSGTNGSMFNTITGTPAWIGNQVTIDLTTQLNVDYPEDSICGCVIECGTLEPTYEDWVETSAAGTFDEAGHFLLSNVGAVDDDFTLEFSDATHFQVTGVNEGLIGSGTTGGDFAPLNPATSTPYMTIEAAGWGGTWAVGETITFTTHPPSQPIWGKEKVTAGAAVESANQAIGRLYVG